MKQTRTIVTEPELHNDPVPGPLILGCHQSPAGGYMGMITVMDEVRGSTFQYFSRNPRGSGKRSDDQADIAAYLAARTRRDLPVILAHAPYTLNPASATPSIREFADLVLREDLESLALIPGSYYNFHPGSHVGQGLETGLAWIIERLDRVTDRPLDGRILLETMAGKGTEIGSRFEEIARIIQGVSHHEVLGVCLDTCHVHDAGYDIVDDLDGVLAEFDRIIGLDRLLALHLNDSKNPLGSRKDRHERIGEGHIGLEAFRRIVTHPQLRHLPMFLETPNDLAGYAGEIALLQGMAKAAEAERILEPKGFE